MSLPLVLKHSSKAADVVVHYMFMFMDKVLYVWAGVTPHMDSWVMALPPRTEMPSQSATLVRSDDDCVSESLAKRLAKKYNAQVFASCKVPKGMETLQLEVERTIFLFLKQAVAEREDVQTLLKIQDDNK
eukprot:m.220869 g.220869  ORF g.220869 m.220869 type:complete len:130 (-) comp13836_c1_seq2:1454-1843(-)